MNLLDLILAVLFVWFAISGILRGLVRLLFSLGGLIAGHLAGVRWYGFAQAKLGLSFQYAEVVGYAVVFLSAYLAVRLIGGLIEGQVRKSKLKRSARLRAGGVKSCLIQRKASWQWERRGSDLPRSRTSRFSSLLVRRSSPVQSFHVHQARTKKGQGNSPDPCDSPGAGGGT